MLNDNKILGANDLLVNISYGAEEASMDEYALINEYLQGEAGMDANLKCGLCYDEALGNKISVTVIATGFNRKENKMKNFVLEETENKLDDNIFEEFHPEQHDLEANADDEAEVAKERRQTSIFDFIENPSEKPRVDSKNQELIDRISHLRRLKEKASQAEESDELDEPAYKRRGVALDEIPHSSEPGVSRFSLIDEPDKKPEIRANNSFLHDNVD